MGYQHIIHIEEDAITQQEWERIKPELGEAVLQVILGTQKNAKWANVLGQSCVHLCDEVHSADSRAYLWALNCLRPLHALDDEGLAEWNFPDLVDTISA